MRKFILLAAVAGLALPQFAAAKTFKDVPVVDTNCSKRVASTPDAHTRDCALKCAAGGFGIITADNNYLKFDHEGNRQILQQLKASDKSDHLRVNVDGEVKGDTLMVKSVKLL